jgi:hypothetical protein
MSPDDPTVTNTSSGSDQADERWRRSQTTTATFGPTCKGAPDHRLGAGRIVLSFTRTADRAIASFPV